MSAIDLLGDIICQGGKVDIAGLGQKQDVRTLFNCGLLREAGVVASIVCTDCEDPHASEVIFDESDYGHFCHHLGFVRLDRLNISAAEPDLTKLIEHLAETFSCTRRKVTPVHGKTWRIGSVKTDHGDITLYFHPRLGDEGDARALADALSREMASTWRIIVTACGRLPVSGALTVTLSELVELSPQMTSLIPAKDLHTIVGVPTTSKTGAPNRHGFKCMNLIRSRIVSGTALDGRNEEAKAVHALLKADFGSDAPSLPTVKTYVTKARSG